ncbi:hypothetical protein PTKU15_89050 [Paraburkholderia terrae]|nr:hypothetical protein PTKU15_89050 [Paraburkholderia terrae]
MPSKREGPGYVCMGAFSVVLDAQSVLATASPAIYDFAGLHKGKLDARQPIGRAFTAHFVDEGKRSIQGIRRNSDSTLLANSNFGQAALIEAALYQRDYQTARGIANASAAATVSSASRNSEILPLRATSRPAYICR